MVITDNDLKQYRIGIRILTKTFSSSSKALNIAMKFLSKNKSINDQLRTLCTYEIRNQRTALDVQNISLFKFEKEILI
jgi:hypothetical protein